MSTTSMTAIAKAVPADAPDISQTLARAFQTDPVLSWVIPDATRRRAQLPAVFAAFVEAYLPHDETYLATDGAAAALWAPAEADPMSDEQAAMVEERLAEALDDEEVARAASLSAVLDQHHPAQPCAYLQFMGVGPEHQGRGLGGRLLTTVLQRCDATGTPAYLEATSTRNRRLYQRHGFDTISQISVHDGPPLWAMWRDPVTTAGTKLDTPRGSQRLT